MEHGIIERELQFDLPLEVVFAAVSDPAQIRQWWADDADIQLIAGATGELTWNHADAGRKSVMPITVVEVDPPRMFSFRWVYPEGALARRGNSLLVEFELARDGAGTLLNMTESGLLEKGWEPVVVEAYYQYHDSGWDVQLDALRSYLATHSSGDRSS
jgi:uncharacterized protein YndB with AHSA1/START domain